MRVYLQYKELDQSGKCKFLSRLIPALADIGVWVTRKEKGAGLALGMSKWRNGVPDMPRVLRVDGIYYDPKNKRERWRNSEIRKSIKRAHGIIFQSLWSRDVVMEKLNVHPKQTYVIHNGALPIEEPIGPRYHGNTHKPVFDVIMAANWGGGKAREDKHLEWHLKIAHNMRKITTFQFHLVGQTPYHVNNTENVCVHGPVDDTALRAMFGFGDALLYLSTPDSCPNTVVEALVAGLPVVCIGGCGVEELVGENGYVCNYADEAMEKLLRLRDKEQVVDAEHLHIGAIAQQYKAAFERILNAPG